MADALTARRIASTLPGVSDRSTDAKVVLYAGGTFFAWTPPVRGRSKGPRAPRLDVLVLRCPLEAKETILEADPHKFFADPHYDGHAAVLLRLDAVDEAELRPILISAWRCVAPPGLVDQLATG